jgi:hypothetical protein
VSENRDFRFGSAIRRKKIALRVRMAAKIAENDRKSIGENRKIIKKTKSVRI